MGDIGQVSNGNFVFVHCVGEAVVASPPNKPFSREIKRIEPRTIGGHLYISSYIPSIHVLDGVTYTLNNLGLIVSLNVEMNQCVVVPRIRHQTLACWGLTLVTSFLPML